MIYTIALIFSIATLLLANPLPQDSENLADVSSLIASDGDLLGPDSNLESMNVFGEGALQDDTVPFQDDCSPITPSSNLFDEPIPNLTKRKGATCRSDSPPKKQTIQANPDDEPGTLDPALSTSDSDDSCANYKKNGRSKHVSCGGPKITPIIRNIASVVLNCLPGGFQFLRAYYSSKGG